MIDFTENASKEVALTYKLLTLCGSLYDSQYPLQDRSDIVHCINLGAPEEYGDAEARDALLQNLLTYDPDFYQRNMPDQKRAVTAFVINKLCSKTYIYGSAENYNSKDSQGNSRSYVIEGSVSGFGVGEVYHEVIVNNGSVVEYYFDDEDWEKGAVSNLDLSVADAYVKSLFESIALDLHDKHYSPWKQHQVNDVVYNKPKLACED